MKNLNKIFSIALIAIITITTSSFAGTKDKAVTKATEAVEQGAPDDYVLLANQANYLLKRDAGLSTAKMWIEQSLSIKQDTYNTEVMGDYYRKCNLHREAVSFYIKSIELNKQVNGVNVDTRAIQDKIKLSKSMM
ncbi:MAG: hypothetical protein OCD76_18725 [Reichenbachiella sp.]